MLRLALTLAILGALLVPVAHGEVLLKGDFETEGKPGEPEGWRFVRARGESFSKWDDEHLVSGRRSLRLAIPRDAAARAHWVCSRHIPVKPSTWYRLSVKIMAVNVTGEAYAICYENGEGDPEHFHYTPYVRQTEDWQEYSVVFRSRADAKWVSVVCKLRHGTGYAWFDDVALAETSPGPKPEAKIRVPPEDDGFALQAMWTPAQWCRDNTMHLVRGHLNPLAVFLWGDKKSIRSPAIILEASAGITLRGPVVKGRGPMPEDIRVTPQIVQRDGRTFRSWRFPIPREPLLRGLRDKPNWVEYHHVYANVAPDCPAEGEFRWRLENDGQLGPEHRLPVVVPAGIPRKLDPPDNFRIYVQHTGALRHPDTAVRERLIEYLNTAGIVGGLAMTFYESDKADVDEQYKRLGFDLHTWRFDGYAGSVSDEHRVVDDKGVRSKSKVCPQSQIQQVQPWYDSLRNYYREKLASGLKRLIIDYEPPVFNVCFCERCRKAFAERCALPEDECLSLLPKELQDKYAKQWGLFRAEQNGAIVKLHCNLIHGIDPEVAVGLCSWRGSQWRVDRGGDIALFEPGAAFHAPMIYTHGPGYHKGILETCRRTTAPVVPFIEIHDILISRRSLTPRQLRMNLLATGLSGGGGAFMWVGMECFDAAYMKMIAQAVREVDAMRAAVPFTREPVEWLVVEAASDEKRSVTVDGTEVAILSDSLLPDVRSHVWGTDDKALVGLLNYGNEESYKVQVKLVGDRPGDCAVISRLPGETRQVEMSAAALRRGVTVEIPPQGLAALVVKRLR